LAAVLTYSSNKENRIKKINILEEHYYGKSDCRS